MASRISPRVLLVGALLLAATGGVAAATVDRGAPLEVAATGGESVSDADGSRSSWTLGPGSAPTSSTAVATAEPGATTTASSRRTAGATTTTAPPAAGSTTPTTLDWRAAGLPGPVGSTIYPWRQQPYVESHQGVRSSVTTYAGADGAVPGTVMPLEITAHWTQWEVRGSIELVGPMDYSKPYDEQRTQVLDSWDLVECHPFTAGVERTVRTDLPMEIMKKPEYWMNDLQYEVRVMRAPCDQPEMFHQDAWVSISFHVDEPFVVQPPSPGLLSSTG